MKSSVRIILSAIVGIFKKIVPQRIIKIYIDYSTWIKIKAAYRGHLKALSKIKNKKKLKVAFFVIHRSVWKYDGLYHLFKLDIRFEPVIVICPFVTNGIDEMNQEMNDSYKFFKNKDYNVLKSHDSLKDKWLDVKKEISPDLIFFTNPHKLTKEEYYITNYHDTLTAYVPYFFVSNNHDQSNYNQLFHNILWKAFYETNLHLNFAKKEAFNKGSNVVVSGYPALDTFFSQEYTPNWVWKNSQESKRKNIIWAPHHTVSNSGAGLDYSCFEAIAEFMLDLARKYEKILSFSFKPHPLLKRKLYQNLQWGIDRTDTYFKSWEELPNCQLNLGNYTDLFLTSDALIHDSASFMSEYLATGKPSLYTIHDQDVTSRMNAYGQRVFLHHYHAREKIEIENFVKNVVINGFDVNREKRLEFVNSTLVPPGSGIASLNIYNYLCEQLFIN